jgi:copper chaperone CopZ
MSRGTYGPALKGAAEFKRYRFSARGMETVTYEVGGMSCQGCVSNLTSALEAVEGVSSVEVEVGSAVIQHEGVISAVLDDAITGAGFTVGLPEFNWSDGSVWKQSAHNTKWCLIGCSIGDFGTIAAFQFIPYLDALGWTPMMIMALAMFNGIMTSIALETIILSAQMALKEAFRVAIGMSLISMISMEAAMNAVDLVLTGGAMLNWWVIPIMLIAGFLTPWPYNYWRLKKYGVSCH